MKRALHAGAAALALGGSAPALGGGALSISVTACASDDARDPARDGGHGSAGTSARDASPLADASGTADADGRPDASERDADAGGMPAPIAGDDHLRFDGVTPSPQGVLRVAFDAPDDAVSFVVTVDPGAVPRLVRLVQVDGPEGLLWSALETGPHPFEPLALRNVGDALPYAVMLPSAPQLPLVPGRYEVAVRAGTDGDAEVGVDVVVKRAPAEPAAGTLAVALWFVAGAGLDAEAAGEDERLQDALAAFTDIYAAAGIALELAAPRDLAGQAAEALAVLEDDAETAELLARLAAEDAGAQDRALHVVFVARIDAGEGRTVRGRSTGLPGPPAHPALARRGAVIAGLDTLPAAPGQIGELLAHESAHFLGLRHSSEFDGLRHDPLADTPECPAERASQTSSDGTPLLSAEDCADLDGGNLLFYTPPQSATPQGELSADQAFVLRHSPLVR
jgi:hypothetical protein